MAIGVNTLFGSQCQQKALMKKYITYTILSLIFMSPAFSGGSSYMEVRQNIIEIANQIEKINRFDCEAIGHNRQKPASYKLYEQLTANATVKELIQLVEHHNAVVQCYSMKALSEKDNVDMLPILFSQLSNAKNLVAMCGSTEQTLKVFDYVYGQLQYLEEQKKVTLDNDLKDQIYQNILYNNYDDYVAYIKQFKGKSASSSIKQTGMDKSLALYHATSLDDILLKIQTKQTYYNRIREITMDSICENAIIALAKYQNPADITIIKSYFPKHKIHTIWLKAVFEFPSPWFLTDLEELQEQYLEKEYCRINMVCRYYTVLLQYKNQKSIEIIRYGLENIKYTKNRNCHLEALYAALEIYPDPYYSELKKNVPIAQNRKDKIQNIIEDYKKKEN